MENENMKKHTTKHVTGILLEHPNGNLLRLDIDGREPIVLSIEEANELHEVLEVLRR